MESAFTALGIRSGTGLGSPRCVAAVLAGPPLAMLFNNQGRVKEEFRAGVGSIRVAERAPTAIVFSDTRNEAKHNLARA
jgi:hypothetical protein